MRGIIIRAKRDRMTEKRMTNAEEDERESCLLYFSTIFWHILFFWPDLLEVFFIR